MEEGAKSKTKRASVKVARAAAKTGRKPKAPKPKPTPADSSMEEDLIQRAIKKVEQRMDKELKPTVADLIRLLQYQKDLGLDQPRQVTVKWIETEQKEPDTEE